MTIVGGSLPTAADGSRSASGYAPGYGVQPLQLDPPTTDTASGAGGQLSSVQVVRTNSSSVTSISAANTGLPVNTPVIVQKAVAKSTGSVASLAAAFTNAVTAGNSVVVVTGIGNGTDPTIADTLNNTYTKAITGANSTTFEASIWYASGIVGGANTVTVTNAGTAASMVVQIYEVSGLLTQSPLGQTTTGTGTGTAASTGNVSGTPNTLAFAGVSVGTAAQNLTAGSGWTFDSAQQNPTTPAGLFSFGSFSQFIPGISAIAPTFTIASSEPWAVAVALFRPVALGVEGVVTIGGYNYTNITTQTTTNIKTGPGVLHAVIINKPLASGVVEIDDATSHTTPIIGTITLPGTLLQDGPKVATYDVRFSSGLSITTSGATQDITVVWR